MIAYEKPTAEFISFESESIMTDPGLELVPGMSAVEGIE